MVCVKDSLATLYNFTRDDAMENTLTGMINSFGVIEKNHYQKLNNPYSYGNRDFYIKGTGAAYPYLNMQGPFKVVAGREQYYNNQLQGDLNYFYDNAVAHSQGLGF
jgi:hypothetical protein